MRSKRLATGLALSISLGLLAGGQSSTAPGSQPTQDSTQVIQFLSRTISWHRQLAAGEQLATQPSDLPFMQENRTVSDQVVQLAFDYARAQAQIQAKQASAEQAPASAGQYQQLIQRLQQADQQIKDTQVELQQARDKLDKTPASKKAGVQPQVDELESEVSLMQARRDAIASMLDFVNTSNRNGAGLRAQIEELTRSVPAALSQPPGSGSGASSEPSSSSSNIATRSPEPEGIWGLTSDLLRVSSKIRSLESEMSATNTLKQVADDSRQPLVNGLRELVHQGDLLFAAADTANPAQLEQQKQQLDALTSRFKTVSSQMLPLSKISVLLDISQRTLGNWRDTVREEEHSEMRGLAIRLGVLAAMIAAVFLLGEIWRRTTFRYVHDARRRYQFLLLRRVLMWVAIGLIILLTFASQLGSAVTFAGLLTAGVAVALQSVLVSVVAYFFLIGRYGIRVGDRVQIAGVTGEVVNIGLVRIHIMEQGGPADSQPTGRIVAFSNSVVFQPTAGVFKQIPGTNFVWHELRLTLGADTDYHIAKERITQAVEKALEEYRDRMENQRLLMERNLSTVSPGELNPKISLHYTSGGIEAIVRFPVELGKGGEIDDRVMKEIIGALEKEPRLKLIGAEIPIAKAGD